MASDVAGKILQNIFTYEKEVKAFRMWQDSVQDVSVYMLITIGIITASTKPLANVRCVEGAFDGVKQSWVNMSETKETPEWVTDRCKTEMLPALAAFLWILPYFDYAVMVVAAPLFVLQRAPFKFMRDRLASLYNLLQAQNKDQIEKALEEHKTMVKDKKCCRVLVFYIWMHVLKYPFAILAIFFIVYNWIITGIDSKEEQDEQSPCLLGGSSYRCFIVNDEEIKYYYRSMVLATIACILVYLMLAVSQAMYFGIPVFRTLKVSILGDKFFTVEQGDHLMLNLLFVSKGLPAALAVLSRINHKFERACTPDMKTWPTCCQLEEQAHTESVFKVEVVFNETKIARRFRQLKDVNQPCHYLVEIKNSGEGKVRSTISTDNDKTDGDQVDDFGKNFMKGEMAALEGKKPFWRPWTPILEKDPDIDLSSISVILTLDDHVHTDFCYERGAAREKNLKLEEEPTESCWKVEKCSMIILRKKTADKDNDINLPEKNVEITVTWELSEVQENDNLLRKLERIAQAAGQLQVLASPDDIKQWGLVVVVSYFVGGIKLGESSAKEIKFQKRKLELKETKEELSEDNMAMSTETHKPRRKRHTRNKSSSESNLEGWGSKGIQRAAIYNPLE